MAFIVLSIGLLSGPLVSQEPAVPETIKIRAELLRTQQEHQALKATLMDREQRLAACEALRRQGIEQAFQGEADRLEKEWARLETELRTLVNPAEGAVFDSKTLTFKANP